MSDFGRFEHHVLPSGAEVWFDPGRHAYFDRIEERPGEKWVGPRDARLPSPSAVGDVFSLSKARMLSNAAARAGLEWFVRKDKRAEEGTAVHEKILETLAAGERIPSLADVSDDERGYAQGVIAWWSTRLPEPIVSEQVVFSAEHRFAGRVDLIATINGRRTAVDLKTGFVGEGAHAQLAGYELAADESGFGPIEATLILKVFEDGTYAEYEGLAVPDDFIDALKVYRRGKALDKGVKDQIKRALEQAA